MSYTTNPALSNHAIFHRWAPEIVLELRRGQQRFNVLLESISGISDRVLSERLRELEATGLIDRQVLAGPPVRVFYGLTPEGVRYVHPLMEFGRLTTESPQEVRNTG